MQSFFNHNVHIYHRHHHCQHLSSSVINGSSLLIPRPTEGRRLSWPGLMVTREGGFPDRRRSPIQY